MIYLKTYLIHLIKVIYGIATMTYNGARCSSVVSVFTHGAMGHWINPSWWSH